MKTLIVYVSLHHHNTEKVAKAMAEAIGAECRGPDALRAEQLAAFDLIGFGSGVYYNSHHEEVLACVSRLNRLLRRKRVFIFSTSGFEEIASHQALRERLEEHGAEIVGEFKCGGWNTYGPFELGGGLQQGRPDRMDLQSAADFARDLVSGLEAGELSSKDAREY